MKKLAFIIVLFISITHAQSIPGTAYLTSSKDSVLSDEEFLIEYTIKDPIGHVYVKLIDTYFEAIGDDRWDGEIKEGETKMIRFRVRLKEEVKGGIEAKVPLSVGFSYLPFEEQGNGGNEYKSIIIKIIDYNELLKKYFNREETDSRTNINYSPQRVKIPKVRKEIIVDPDIKPQK